MAVREDFLEEREAESSGSRQLRSKHPALHSGLEMRHQCPVCHPGEERGRKEAQAHPCLCEVPKYLWLLTEKLQEQTGLRTA